MFFKHHHSGIENTISDQEFPLSQLPVGVAAQVVRIKGGNGLVNRVACLGFTPGVAITLLQNFGHGPLIACVRGARLALGRGEAEQILVRAVEA